MNNVIPLRSAERNYSTELAQCIVSIVLSAQTISAPQIIDRVQMLMSPDENEHAIRRATEALIDAGILEYDVSFMVRRARR